MRWLHIYASMLGLGALVFFSATGITLNHPDWTLGTTRTQEEVRGQVEAAWVEPGLAEAQIKRLEVVEHLRRVHRVQGTVDEVRADEQELFVAFKGPGYAADAWVTRSTGAVRMTVAREGWVAVVNDLHKGRHTGGVWAWVIDLSAGVMLVLSATGLVLLMYLRRRRWRGLAVGMVGTAALVAVVWGWVP